MLKVVCLMKAKPGLSHQEFRDYYENNHVPMVLKLLPLMADYRRSYVVPSAGSALDHMGGSTDRGFDVITECWYRDQQDYDAMVALTRNSKIGQALAENEATFIDQDAMVVFIADECCTSAAELAESRSAYDI
jgi:EthD domain